MSLQSIVEWVTDPNTCFLFGAGCSLCAGKPSIAGLTETVRSRLTQPVQDLLEDLKGNGSRPANVEDLINYLLRIRQLAESRNTPFEREDWKVETVDSELLGIQKAIVEEVGVDWKSSCHHERFLTRLASARPRKPIDIFSLNYDTVLEASLESVALRYTDGFVGSENAYFDPSVFDHIPEGTPFFRLYKLHGSVNWIRRDDDSVRRCPGNSLGESPRAVVYPAEQKYVQTQYGIYETLMRCFRDRLRAPDNNNKLIVLGYGFGDEHINVAIEDSIRTPGSNLTVHAFVGPEEDMLAQRSRFETMLSRCDHRLNVVIGTHCHLGPALDDAAWGEIAGKELWKFENLICLLAGATNE